MTTLHIHATKKICFESEGGELDLTIKDQGMIIHLFSTSDGQGPTTSRTLPLSMAAELRDFLIYALRGYPEGDPK